MIRRMVLVCLIILVCSTAGWSDTQIVRIGTDQGFWYPFTYSENGIAKGIHIDMTALALKNLGYQVEFSPVPWKRCLYQAEQGQLDAVVCASYKPDRAEYLYYPSDASTAERSKWRIMQVEYIVMTHSDDAYEFTGDLNTLPAPVRAPLGYSIVDDLKTNGVDVITSPDIRACVSQLVQSRRGCVVTPPQNAKRFNAEEKYAEQIKIHAKPATSKSYFMVFAKSNQKLSMTAMEKIWEEIAHLREDEAYMDKLFDRYAGAGAQ